ncbi:MAG: hypothetical protein GWN87_22065, partial [Desulfuromonadales bacterium]|nr:hypothetical protein [Desulfuromonadales bacterium]
MSMSPRINLAAALVMACLLALPAFAAETSGQDSMIERYRMSLEIDPDNPTLHYFLGIALIRDGQTRA